MADRTIRMVLKAEVDSYKRSMAEAAAATAKVGAESGTTTSALGRMVSSARDNREAWQTTGTALLAVGTAITAIGVAALKTGIEYNTLQQTSRAALTTLLGSAQAANAQMDKLDEFARTSPFAKQVFITAQQQMLGFGIETQKVIPYLDAIQNAVAAMGGSNDDVAQLTRIMSQISASAKITATDLQEFGNRGVDAATIIGSQMGKTGAQIRTDITAGTLDAQVALDALAAGMQDRFGGAAANIKETFVGATDRVKAAWRDLSSELAAPFVDPESGGLLVDWLNDLADAMRAFQDAPEWVKVTTVGLAGLVGVAALLAGGALVLVPRLVALYDALGKMGPAGTRAQAGMRHTASALPVLGAALAVGTFAFTTWMAEVGRARDMSTALAETLDETAGVTDDTSAAIRDMLAETRNISFMNFDAAYTEAEKMGIGFDTLTDYVLGNADAIDEVNAKSDEFVGGSSAWENVIQSRQGAVSNLKYTLDTMTGSLTDAERAELQKIQADQAAGVSAEGLAESTDTTTESIEEQVSALQEQIALLNEQSGVVKSEMEAQAGLEAAYDNATAAIEANGATLDITTEAGRDNQDALIAIRDACFEVIASMEANGASQGELQGSMLTTRERFLATAEAMGVARVDAEGLADQLGLIPEQINTTVNVSTEEAQRRSGAFVAAYTNRVIPMTVAIHADTGSMTNAEYAAFSAVYGGSSSSRGARGGGGNFAGGGAVSGPGTSTSDSVLIAASDGEHMLPAREVDAVGGQSAVYRMRAAIRAGALRYADGGEIRGYDAGRYVSPAHTTAVTWPAPAPAGGSSGRSLVGLAIEGTLLTPWGPSEIRGVVRDELADAGSQAAYRGRA
jgi:tape measure domain-containing protein